MRFDPEISEWGNLAVVIRRRPSLNKIGEGSRYPVK